MYKRIMLPIDLAHTDRLDKALATAVDLSRHYGAPIYCVGVTASAPSAVGHNPEEYARKLDEFVAARAAKEGVEMIAKSVISHDPVRDLDDVLQEQIGELEIDLVIMASHVPTFGEHLLASNAGYLAAHTDTSVFIVR